MTLELEDARPPVRSAPARVDAPSMPNLRGLRVALAGGGTGGHVVPGRHLLAHARGELGDVLWFATGRKVEENAFAGVERDLGRSAFERVSLELEPDGGGAPSLARTAFRAPPAIAAARAALKRHKSEVVIGLGGFTCVPAVLAARSLGIRVALLEINSVRGRATRWLASCAGRVCHAWRATLPGGGESARDRWTGPPLDPRYARALLADGARAARIAEGFEPARPLLVVLGGSQGSQALNEFVRDNFAQLASQGLQVLHQVGPGRLDSACGARAGYRAVEYLDDVHRALSAATLVLCRGGASTLAEVGALRRPAWVVPYPHHRDRHQEHNARALGAGALVVDQSRLGAAFARELVQATSGAGQVELERMSAALDGRVPLDAAARVWREVAALCDGRLT